MEDSRKSWPNMEDTRESVPNLEDLRELTLPKPTLDRAGLPSDDLR